MRTPRDIIAMSECVLGHGLKNRGRRQSADCIIFDLEEAGYRIVHEQENERLLALLTEAHERLKTEAGSHYLESEFGERVSAALKEPRT